MGSMQILLDAETIMRNHDASVERKGERKGKRKGKRKGERKGRQEAADLINSLWGNGRGEDAMRAARDEKYYRKLMKEFKGVKAPANGAY